MRKIFKNNLIKLTIGLLLLFFCYLYIQKYPAEKIAIFSWFDVMIQRVEIFFNKFSSSGKSEDLKTKYDYEKAYEELLRVVEANGCKDPNIHSELLNTLESLQSESSKTLSENMPMYMRKATEFKTRVAESCRN